MPKGMLPKDPTVEGVAERSGMKYVAANPARMPCLPSPRGGRGRVRTVLFLKGPSLTLRPSALITKPIPFTHFVTPRGSADLLGGCRPPSLFSLIIINSSPFLGQPSVPGLAMFFVRLLLTPFRPAGARRFPGPGWLRGPKLSKNVGGETCVLRPAVSPTVSPFFGSAGQGIVRDGSGTSFLGLKGRFRAPVRDF